MGFLELNNIPGVAYFTLNEEYRLDYLDVKLYEELQVPYSCFR